jgi:hypothetical protein
MSFGKEAAMIDCHVSSPAALQQITKRRCGIIATPLLKFLDGGGTEAPISSLVSRSVPK